MPEKEGGEAVADRVPSPAAGGSCREGRLGSWQGPGYFFRLPLLLPCGWEGMTAGRCSPLLFCPFWRTASERDVGEEAAMGCPPSHAAVGRREGGGRWRAVKPVLPSAHLFMPCWVGRNQQLGGRAPLPSASGRRRGGMQGGTAVWRMPSPLLSGREREWSLESDRGWRPSLCAPCPLPLEGDAVSLFYKRESPSLPSGWGRWGRELLDLHTLL